MRQTFNHKIILILIVFFIVLVNQLFACSCKNFSSFYWHYNKSDKVFKGKVLSIKQSKGNERHTMRAKIILFKVLTKYKGDIVTDTVSLSTGNGGGDCGLRADTNDIWLIFSSNDYTGLCNGNLLIERNGMNTQNWSLKIYAIYKKPLEDILSKKTQYIKEYDSKKKLLAEGQITKGITEGYWNYHFEDDGDTLYPETTHTKVFYKSGLKDSIEYEYYKSGKLHKEQVWHNNKENGKCIVYYPNGTIDYSEYYVDGKKDGLWERFHRNGKYYSKEYYSMSQYAKLSTQFYENGDTSCVYYYDNNGKIIKSWMKYKSGKLESTNSYKLIDSFYYVYSTSYYENGNIKSKTCRCHDKKWKFHGEQISYYENGIVNDKTYYDKGEKIGKWYYFDDTGKLIKTENKSAASNKLDDAE